jgi:hypothetical protein
MSTRWVRASVIALGALAAGVYVATRQSRSGPDTIGPGERPQDPFRNNEEGKVLRHFLSVMDSHGEDAARVYDQALEPLRAKAERVVVEIAHVESFMKETDYPSRWALIFAASELRSPAALPYLRAVALSRIPSERSRDTHSFSTVAEETILRTTAVEGIGRLARDNNAQAVDTLFECLSRPVISIRRAAVQELLSTPDGRNQYDRIAASLPEDQRFLLDLRHIEVHQAPQIRNPRQFLAPAARTDSISAPPPVDKPRDGGRVYTPSGKNQPPTLTRR